MKPVYSPQALPPLRYELRISARAKRASLRCVPGRGLVVSVPRGYSEARVIELVASQRAWIDSRLAEIENNTPDRFRQWPPGELLLPAIGKRMLLSYAVDPRSQKKVTSHKPDSASDLPVIIDAPISDRAAVAREIASHLKELARYFLVPRLAAFSHYHGLRYQRVSIRGQRTVWGSCSTSGTISLNYKLLFLDKELTDYVLLHELAHTIHMDHSAAFWACLCSLSLEARALDARLANAAADVPPWLELATGKVREAPVSFA